jgi:type I restriction enzyme M protein
MALKKSDLYSSLWASCDELRGGMDASQYKDYVLFNHRKIKTASANR